jgi:hypothetical protein
MIIVSTWMYSFVLGFEESLFAVEDEEDNVKPLPDWITYRLEEKLPPQVNLTNCKPCTPSYYRLPHNVNFMHALEFLM